jgi:hypothetical protein
MRKLTLVLISAILLINCNQKTMKTTTVSVDASQVIYTMRAGLGASWHTIENIYPLHNEKYKFPVREENPLGSAWGGNPPVTHIDAWQQIKDHASWLGMNFLRVELSQRMYEPERRQFSWDNSEMQALYNILDWCEENSADVFLQQMVSHVEWNSYPGVHPLISAPRSLDDFASGIATLLEYLTREKGYTCIKYFCMTNEPPGGPWGYWWEYGDAEGSIDDAWKRLKEEFDNRGIAIPISGPDWTSMPPFEEEKLGFAQYLGAIDIHSYSGVTAEGEENLRRWAEWSHAQDKPFLLTEFGNMNLGWGTDNPAQKSFDAALSNASDVIRGLRVGVDGFNRWSFTNRGDLDGQWQLIKTFDWETKTYLDVVVPEPEAYYGFAMLSRFLAKYSSVVSCQVSESDSVIMAAAVVSPSGELSVFMLNLTDDPKDITLDIESYSGKSLQVYQASKELVNVPGFSLEPGLSINSSKKTVVTLPARSITTVSGYKLNSEDIGIF